MKKAILLILFAILQTNVYAACQDVVKDLSCSISLNGGSVPASQACGSICGSLEGTCSGPGTWNSFSWCASAELTGYGPRTYSVTCIVTEAQQQASCGASGGIWNPSTCQCDPPPCQVFQRCETYWNTGNGMGVAIGPGIVAQTDPNYTGAGYYAMRLFEVDTCTNGCGPTGCVHLLMDVPGTCAEHGYCDPGDNSCNKPVPGPGSSSSAGSSSSYEPPECVCMGCFGGSCMVTCSDGSSRTCAGDFENCTELKNSPEWTQCTAPSSSPSGGSSSGGGGSSASPSSQANAVDGLNALIDTLHHSNQLQEVGHGIMRDGQEQNKGFFEDARAYFAGVLKQVTGIFGNTNNINNNTNNINKNLNSIEGKLDNIANRPRDTTIVNVGGDTINIKGDTNIINIPIDSAPGLPWDTAASVAGFRGSWDSLAQHLDSMVNPDTIHTGPPDSLIRGLYGVLDSGAGRIYRDTIDGLVAQGIANNVLSGQGSNTCPAFIMSSYPITIGPVTFDLTQNVKLGQYLCNPVIGGKSAWDIGRTILRIVVAIGCMFFLFRCATGTLGGEE